jgi:UDP-N-acetylmuramoyl-tripeptide--D-alanyl-D-alanine ligase
MAFFEIATSGRPGTDRFASRVLELSDWMIDVHRTLERTRNTAYAYEGIIHAFHLAQKLDQRVKAAKYRCTIEIGLEKLTSWQVNSPIANSYISRQPTANPKASGGVQNHRREALLRIDVTQHQMHAVILALKYVFLPGT